MVGVMLRFLPPEKRALTEFIFHLYERLDVEERKDLAEHCDKILEDGKIGLPEWGQFGKKIGAFRLGK
jgi:hypothetical protein|tara:strand:+ start:144 stop:347 length:204 start_codon:yes stop_codon:yes gene_type:complete